MCGPGRAARWIAGAALLSLLSAYAGWASGAPRLRPSLVVSGEFSDNVDLDPEDEKAAFVTRVTPGVSFRGDTSRFQGGFDGALRTRYTTAGDDQGLQFNGALTGSGDLQLVRDVLFLEGDASVSQEVLNNEQAQSDANLDTVQVYRASPVLRNRFGGFAISELRYILGQLLVSSDDVADTTAHVGQASLASGSDFDRLRWILNGRISESLRSGASNVSRADVILETEYGITKWISPIAAGGYQSFDDGDQSTQFDSPAYWGGLRWRPGRRTEVVLTYGRRDDRFSPAASLRYRLTEDSNVLVRYFEGLSTSQERLLDNLAFIGIDRETGEFVDERSDLRFDPRPDPFDIDDTTEYIKAVRADLALVRGRYAMGLRGYFGREEQVLTGDEEDVYRIDAFWSRRLGRRLSFDLSGGYEHTELALGREEDEYRVQPGLRYLLSPKTTLFADYRYRWQDSDDPTAEYTENRVGAGVRVAW